MQQRDTRSYTRSTESDSDCDCIVDQCEKQTHTHTHRDYVVVSFNEIHLLIN